MKRDLGSVIGQVAGFLDCSLTKEKKEQLIGHLDIKNFRNNPAVNAEIGKTFGFMNKTGNFIRKGKVGLRTLPPEKWRNSDWSRAITRES